MANSYQVKLEHHRAQEAMREAQKQKARERDWMERLLSADEKAEYGRLQAATLKPPRNLGHRAAWPAYVLLAPWAAAVFVLLWLLMEMQSGSTAAQRIPVVLVFLVVMFGGMAGVFTVLLRRTRTAMKAYEDASSMAVRDYLDRIGYEGRLSEAQRKAGEDESHQRATELWSYMNRSRHR